MRSLHTAFLAAAAIPALTCPLYAQAADPTAVLDATRQALTDAPGFGAQFRLAGSGATMFEKMMPSINGRVVFAKVDGEPLIHILGEARDKADADPYAYDIVRTPTTFRWTDDAAQTIYIRKAEPAPRELQMAGQMMQFANLVEKDPFQRLTSISTSVTHEGTETISGTNCDIILFTFKENLGRNAPTHNLERWYIAQDDHLPRKVQYTTVLKGMSNMVVTTEISKLEVGEPPASMVDIRRPDNYKVDDRTKAAPRTAAPKPAPTTTTPKPTETTQAPKPKPAPPADPMAPAFSFTDDAGTTINNASQNGRVTVLYFWGTWCVPCRAVSPKISELAAAFKDQPVDTFGLAIRERDPGAARSYLKEHEYAHRLVTGSDQTANLFKIRMYPTVVVINPEGRIIYSASLSKERTPDDLARELDSAVQRALIKT